MKNLFGRTLLAACLAGQAVAAGGIDLTVTGFATDTGVARVVLMRGEEGYSGARPANRVASVAIRDGAARWRADVPPGSYAIIAHHDRDADGALNRPVLGLPLEPYGFSGGGWTSFGLPDFESVAFGVGADTVTQTIRIRSNGFVTLAKVLAIAATAIALILAGLARHRHRMFRKVPSQERTTP